MLQNLSSAAVVIGALSLILNTNRSLSVTSHLYCRSLCISRHFLDALSSVLISTKIENVDISKNGFTFCFKFYVLIL